MNKFSVFIVSRPIQFVNVLNIPDFNNIKDKLLIIINTFEGANLLISNQKEKNIWANIIIKEDIYSALNYILQNKSKIKSLYTFSDFGIRLQYFFYRLNTIDIYLYEEGAATYNPSFFKNWGVRSILYKIINLNLKSGCFIGSYRKIKGIYVNNPDLFNNLKPFCKSKVYSFNMPFFEHISSCNNIDIFIYKDLYNLKDKKVLLYITDWTYDNKIHNILHQYNNYFHIIKPHPHLKRNYEFDNLFNLSIDGKYIAEVIISILIEICSDLIIVHNNSTTLLSFLPIADKFKEINLRSENDNSWYSKIEQTIKLLNKQK